MPRLILFLFVLGITLVYGRTCHVIYNGDKGESEECQGLCYRITIRDKKDHENILANKAGCDHKKGCSLPNNKIMDADALLKFGIVLKKGAEGWAKKQCCDQNGCNPTDPISWKPTP